MADNVVGRAAEFGLEAIAAKLKEGGIGPGERKVIVMLAAETADETGDSTIVVQGFEDSQDVLDMIALHTRQYEGAVGFSDRVTPTETPV